jgi:hypothetical protein
MKKLLGILVLGLLWCNTSFAESSLPLCEGEDDTQWTNCFGTYLKKDLKINGFTRDYTGEFSSTPGKREGKGKSRVYRDGKFHSTYVGEFKDDKPNGQGTHTVADGDKYVGEFKDGKYHGQGTYTYANGETYVGKFKDHKFNGQGTYTWPDGAKYIGEFKDDAKHGQGNITYADGAKYVGEWRNDKRDGKGTMTYADGTVFVGEWKNNIKQLELKSEEQLKGKETLTYANGDKYVGELQDGKRNGQGTMTYANGDKFVGKWLFDTRDGKGTMTYANGDEYIGTWSYDERIEGTMNYANGDKFVGKWLFDKRDGKGTMTYADGTVFVGQWSRDKISLSLGLHDIPLINFAIKCNTVDYINTKMEWFWDRDSMTVTQFSRYGKKFIKAFKDAGFSKDQVKIAIEEGKEGLTHNITDWNSSKIIFTTKLSADYKFDGEEFEIMSNSLKYQEKCRLIEFKEQEQKTKKKKPIKRDKELDNLKKEADVMSRNAAACHINSTGNTRKLLGGHINYLYSLVQNSKLQGYGNEQMYRQIISASDTILKLGKCN